MEETTGNSNNTEDNNFFDEVADSVMDDSGNFFDDLEKEVNGVVFDDTTQENSKTNKQNEVTPEVQQTIDPGTVVNEDSAVNGGIDWDSDTNPYKKRYSDSSREAQQLKAKVDDLGQYDAIIDVMKKDPTLVDKVRDHLQGGGKPTSVKEAFKLPEDFVFDADEALGNPNSDSAKVFDAYIDKAVQQRVAQTEARVNNTIASENSKRQNAAEAEAWRKQNNMSKEDFAIMMDKASQHTINYDDINLILNGAEVKKNVAKGTKANIRKQMNQARKNAPPTASGVGSMDTSMDITEDDKIFSALKSLDSTETLFDS
tara:strand:- start:4767 stop:5708 length:942 start_codon:yes stop_codon:yes gene_type:complete